MTSLYATDRKSSPKSFEKVAHWRLRVEFIENSLGDDDRISHHYPGQSASQTHWICISIAASGRLQKRNSNKAMIARKAHSVVTIFLSQETAFSSSFSRWVAGGFKETSLGNPFNRSLATVILPPLRSGLLHVRHTSSTFDVRYSRDNGTPRLTSGEKQAVRSRTPGHARFSY